MYSLSNITQLPNAFVFITDIFKYFRVVDLRKMNCGMNLVTCHIKGEIWYEPLKMSYEKGNV